MKPKLPQYLLSFLVVCLTAIVYILPLVDAQEPLICMVDRVVDGDTLKVTCPGNKTDTIRLIGVDTPETKHPSKPVQYFGREASAFTKQMAQGKQVRLEFDQAFAAKGHRGVYGRLLAYVFVKQPDGLWFDLNAQLLAQGYAHAYTRFPFSRMEKFRRLEREAREAGRGLWAESGKPSVSVEAKPPGKCLIKGNIGSKGKKIYHLPGMRYYEQTKIDESKGERWFCTEEEARTAGWMKSSR